MNHDIMHCHGFATKIEGSRIAIDESKPCPERESCYRYIAHLDAKAQGLGYVAYRIGEVENCKRYWK